MHHALIITIINKMITKNNYTNTWDYAYGAITIKKTITRVYPVHVCHCLQPILSSQVAFNKNKCQSHQCT